MIEFLPPALILLAGAFLIVVARGRWRTAAVLVAPLATLWAVWQVPDGVAITLPFLDYQIEPLEGSPLRRLFATVFALMAFVGGLYAYRQARAAELAAAYAYAAGAIGVCFAGDLITLFVFWEFMALFSSVVVWCGGTPAARAAGLRYAIMHILGGVILMVGIAGVAVRTGSVDIQPMLAAGFDTWMLLIGILINAAAPPLSAWLADAYPEASPTGSVFLSAFTTKTAVLALIFYVAAVMATKLFGAAFPEATGTFLERLDRRCQIALLRLLHEGVHQVRALAAGDALPDQRRDGAALPTAYHPGLHRFAARGDLVQDGEVQIDIASANAGSLVNVWIKGPQDILIEKGTVTLYGDLDVRCYVKEAPAEIMIDGAFGDWHSIDTLMIYPDEDPEKVENANVDLREYAVHFETQRFSVYTKVDGTIFGGSLVPQASSYIMDRTDAPVYPDEDNDGRHDENGDGLEEGYGTRDDDFDNDDGLIEDLNNPVSPNTGVDSIDLDDDNDGIQDSSDNYLGSIYVGPGDPPEIPLVPLVARDDTQIFINTDNDPDTGYSPEGLIFGADRMIQVSGRYNSVSETGLFKFESEDMYDWNGWKEDSTILNIETAIDDQRLELGFVATSISLKNGFTVLVRCADWSMNKDWTKDVLVGTINSGDWSIDNDPIEVLLDPFAVTTNGSFYQSLDALTWNLKVAGDYQHSYTGLTAGSGPTAGYIFVLRDDGIVYYTDRGTNGWHEYGYGSPSLPDDKGYYIDIAAGSGTTAGYIYVLRNDGKVFFTDRGTNGWTEYGYGDPDKPDVMSYTALTVGAESLSGYVYVLRKNGTVHVTDRGTNGWYQYGYGAPNIPESTWDDEKEYME